MYILFSDEKREKHIEFTKEIYSMKDLDGYRCFFEKFLKTEWERVIDKTGNLEEIVELMKNTKTIISSLSIGEDEFIPFSYSVNPLNKEKDKMIEIHFDLTNENFGRIQELYFKIYGNYLQESKVR